ILHRVTGVGVLMFLALHIVDTFLVGFGPQVYDQVIAIYKTPFMRVMEVVLGGAVFFHALNGVRVILIDFWPAGTRYQLQMFRAVVVLFVVLFVPTAFIMLRPLFG
ncbi:MAG TPA: succinate dehydrogenase, cytochrome b556 subunit, partial [Bacillota bacterium]